MITQFQWKLFHVLRRIILELITSLTVSDKNLAALKPTGASAAGIAPPLTRRPTTAIGKTTSVIVTRLQVNNTSVKHLISQLTGPPGLACGSRRTTGSPSLVGSQELGPLPPPAQLGLQRVSVVICLSIQLLFWEIEYLG